MDRSLDRRRFLKLTSAAVLATPILSRSAHAAQSAESLYLKLIPTKKGMDAAWAASLVRRHAAKDSAIASEDPSELSKIGMTVGGIGCGTVYLSGDGQLYIWDIFHRPHEGVVAQRLPVPKGLDVLGGHKKIVRERDGANYINPPTPKTFANPFRQEFLLEVDGRDAPRAMRKESWKHVTFSGRWPLGTVDYSDPSTDLAVQLNAWTPFIPLETENSSLPVTVMEYTITNTGSKSTSGKMTGIWENPVLVHSRKRENHEVGSRMGRTTQISGLTHHPESHPEQPPGDWGTATIATIDASTSRDGKDGVDRTFKLAPGEKTTISFLLTWHFPHIPKLHHIGPQKPQYATRFADSWEVAAFVGLHFSRLRDATMAWVRTWNDSTLPQWLLDRTILTTNTLQTTTCEVLAGDDYPDGRFWAWEGIGCCPGTCAHVWHYAQGVARLFPSLERNLREITDYGIAINDDGSIRFRAESSKTVAIDSQTGIVLRTWREHLMSRDHSFLQRVWPKAKMAIKWLIDFDRNGRGGLDGLLDGEQHNTLDAEWYGKVHCLCSLYLAALKAGEAMAMAMHDEDFALQCNTLHQSGSEKIASLFNGEFYIQQEDPAHLNAIGVGNGCYIDQVIGQWWAHQTGLGRIYDTKQIRSALDSLWRYNFVPDIGTFRDSFTRGRFYALGKEAGLVMCTWPKGGLRDDFKKHWQYGYFNECMTGFEWQAAAHMVQEGAPVDDADPSSTLLDDSNDLKSFTLRGLAISRAIHDRYHPSKRNPYNEIECSDHYARANASYSVFLAVCGFSYDGPMGRLGFAPKLNPKKFKAAFTSATGWGSFEQTRSASQWCARITISHGELQLTELQLPWLKPNAQFRHGTRSLSVTVENGNARLDAPITLKAGAAGLTITC